MREPGAECDLLPWDTEHFGFRVARAVEPLLTPHRCARLDRDCRAMGVRCLYLMATPEPDTTRLAEQNGYRLVDVRTGMNRKITETFRPRAIGSRIRRANESDLPALEAIAVASHRNTRFFYDDRFPVERAEALYRTWIRKDAAAEGCDVAIAEAEGQVVGYSTSYACERDVGRISLMAVAPGFRHRGIADDLVNASLGWLNDQGSRTVGVTTQGWNVAAQRVYQRCGFRTSFVELIYHKWFD